MTDCLAPRHPAPAESHTCFGCQKQIGDGELHIHVGLDEWAEKQGLAQFGLDDLLTFAFCEACTVKAKKGWRLEAHKVNRP